MTHLRPGEYIATLNGVKLRYKIAGRGPVLMVQPPGWGVGSGLYERSFGPLEEDFTLVYHDPRGSGGSEHPADEDTLNVGQYAEDLDALRAHLGVADFALIGHSHGGLIALWYAMRHPGRVRRLMPLAAQIVGRVESDEAPEDVVAELARDPEYARGLEVLQTEIGPAMMGSPTDAAFGDVLGRMAPIYFKDQRHAHFLTDFVAANKLPARTVRETSLRDGDFPVARHARDITSPTLFLSGRYDILCPPIVHRALAATMPDARVETFQQSAHFPWIEEPHAFFAAVRSFLAPTLAPRP